MADKDTAREKLLDQILAVYLDAERTGQAPDPEELFRQHPELADELQSFFTDRDHFRKLAAPIQPAAAVQAAASTLAPRQTAAASPPLGRVRYFGDYELVQELARGGMGVVYR